LLKITEVKPILCQGGVKNWTFCKITTDDGIVGWGDGTEWAAPKSVASNISDFGALIVGAGNEESAEPIRGIGFFWLLDSCLEKSILQRLFVAK
jgi:L-alanine-DL-glutamate epimerase-like enolase superfamily enzyme